jgi:hypothetical protein
MAGIALYINAIEPTMNSLVTPAIARHSSSLKNPLVKTALEQTHEEEARQWIENPKRDPFAPVSVAKWFRLHPCLLPNGQSHLQKNPCHLLLKFK